MNDCAFQTSQRDFKSPKCVMTPTDVEQSDFQSHWHIFANYILFVSVSAWGIFFFFQFFAVTAVSTLSKAIAKTVNLFLSNISSLPLLPLYTSPYVTSSSWRPGVYKANTKGCWSGPGSSVGIATGHGLDGPGIESRCGARFSAPVQTGPGAHPACCTIGTGSSPGVKSGRGVRLTPHPLLVPWSWKSRAIPLLPIWAFVACYRVNFTFTFTSTFTF